MRVNPLTIALIPIAILLDILLGAGVAALDLVPALAPVGTILVGALAGPIVGGITGLLSGLIWSFLPTPLGYTGALALAPVALIVGVLAGLFGALRWMRRWPRALAAGLLSGIIVAIAAPVSVALREGAALALDQSTLLSSALVAIPALAAAYLAVRGLLSRLPRRLLVRFPQGDRIAPPHRKPLIGRVE